jgi:hypothetical protein
MCLFCKKNSYLHKCLSFKNCDVNIYYNEQHTQMYVLSHISNKEYDIFYTNDFMRISIWNSCDNIWEIISEFPFLIKINPDTFISKLEKISIFQ